MLAVLGFLTVIIMLVLIMTKKATPLVALIAVPVVTGIISCAFFVTDAENAPGVVNFWANFKKLGGFITGSSGIGSVAATGVMFIFSILFFGILTDAGTFRPIIKKVLQLVGTDPIKIAIGTAILAMIVHLDGSGAVTFLICVPALLPLYDALGMRRTTLATIVALSAGTMNILPWGGPTIRAATALTPTGEQTDAVSFFMPVLPAVIVGLICVLVIAFFLGRAEKARLGNVVLANKTYVEPELSDEEKALLRPKMFWVNIILIIAAIACLLKSGFAPAVIFMVFYVLATLINYPKVAAAKCVEIARKRGLTGMKIACVTGDDLLPVIDKYMDTEVWETGEPLSKLPGEIVSANAYMGVEGILKALDMGADVVITGRVSDPAIFMAPIIHEFGWALDDWDKLGKGTMVGHLLECGGQVTGGYYAEPGKKDVPGVGHLGVPIIQVSEDGSFFVTKVSEAGGMVTPDTCAEQICYEIHDPTNYLTPDVVADFQQVKFTQVDKDVVKVEGATGRPKTETFKCSIGYRDCFIGDGEISYGGPGCLDRVKLAIDILKERLELVAPGQFDELKFDLIGCNSLYWNPDYKYNEEPSEVRVRVADRAKTKAIADLVPNEVEALYTNGPAGGCGAVKRTRDIVSVASILVSRYDVKPEAQIFEV